MSVYLSHLQAEAHAADLLEQARRAHLVRNSRGRPPRLRNSVARVLLGIAIRLDQGLQPTTVRPSTTGPSPC
jgi:hypothetical protein